MLTERKMSLEGAKFLTHQEGVVLYVYNDIVGIPTVCMGHVVLSTDHWIKDGVTMDECLGVLQRDLGRFERCVRRAIKRDIPQQCFDACVSLAYNIGEYAFEQSTVARAANEGKLSDAADAFLLWRFAKVLQKDGSYLRKPALLGRRMAERDMFLVGIKGAETCAREAAEFAMSVMFDTRELLNSDGSERVNNDAEPMVALAPTEEEFAA